MDEKLVTMEVELYLREYISYFNEYYGLLLERYERYKELRKTTNEITLDIETYFDILIVQLRSMLLETRDNQNVAFGNYTIRNIIFLGEDTSPWNDIESMLNEVLISGEGAMDNCKVKDALKIIADKSICHHDNFHRKGKHSWELIQLLKSMLMDENAKINLDYIMKTITNILKGGVDLGLDNLR